MAFDVRAKYRKNHDIASSDNPMLGDMGFSLEKEAERTQYEARKQQQFEKNARLRAIELAKSKASSNAALETNSVSDVNAGDNRTTAYNKPQSISVYGGYGTLPNPATQGMNTAANGAKIDYSAVSQKAKEADTENKGWKGLSRTYHDWLYANNEETEQEYSKKQHDYLYALFVSFPRQRSFSALRAPPEDLRFCRDPLSILPEHA